MTKVYLAVLARPPISPQNGSFASITGSFLNFCAFLRRITDSLPRLATIVFASSQTNDEDALLGDALGRLRPLHLRLDWNRMRKRERIAGKYVCGLHRWLFLAGQFLREQRVPRVHCLLSGCIPVRIGDVLLRSMRGRRYFQLGLCFDLLELLPWDFLCQRSECVLLLRRGQVHHCLRALLVRWQDARIALQERFDSKRHRQRRHLRTVLSRLLCSGRIHLMHIMCRR